MSRRGVRSLRTCGLLVALAVAAALLVPEPALAQAGAGVRAGVSSGPAQFHFGGHLETDPLLDRLLFRPNAEIGIGDDLTLIALNLEFIYRIPIQQQPWSVYFGGGPAVNIYDAHGRAGTDVEGGFNIMVGLQHNRGLFTELKVGALDSPDLKFTIGYAFR